MSARMFSILVVCLAVTTGAAGATVWYVDDSATGANDGTSWPDAFKYLKEALVVASSGDEIRVAEGTYKPDQDNANPTGSGSRSATFQLESGVGLYGGYPDGGGTRDPQASVTTLSGDIGTGGDNSDNSYHVVTGSGTDRSAVLDGFQIVAGNADGPTEWTGGGGMYNSGGSPTVRNCTFTGNSAIHPGAGGGMASRNNSNPKVTNCTFIDNSAVNSSGGGMYNESGSAEVANCTFAGNTALGYSGGSGGGMDSYECSVTVESCSFIGNSSTHGGGMSNRGSISSIAVNCIFSGNVATNRGGGMWFYQDTHSTVLNCTFSANTANNEGGGMYNCCGSSTNVTNCVVWGNDDSGGTDESAQYHLEEGTAAAVSYSCIQGLDAFSGLGNIDDDPQFVDADGSDDTLGTDDDDLHLMRCPVLSPCVDAGDNSAPNLPGTDRDGITRIVDGDNNGAAVVDMGAYEYSHGLGDSDGDGVADESDKCPCYYNPDQKYNRADLDEDCDVDGFDFLTFSNCFNGSNKPPRCP